MTTNAPKKPEEETVNRGRIFRGRSLNWYEQRTKEEIIQEAPLLEKQLPQIEEWMTAHGKSFKEAEPAKADGPMPASRDNLPTGPLVSAEED